MSNNTSVSTQTDKKTPPPGQFIKSFLFWFLLFYVILIAYNSYFGGEKDKVTPETTPEVLITPLDDDVTLGNLAQFRVKNHLSERIQFFSPCGGAEAKDNLQVYRITNQKELLISDFSDCGEKSVSDIALEPGEEAVLSLRYFNNELFSEPGDYKLHLQFEQEESEPYIAESEIIQFHAPGTFRQLFRALISKPLFNLLIFFTQVLPTHSFGWSVILLTILVRLLLLKPNQKAMRSQRELQKLQPKITELREKYKNDQQLLAMKTMELYRTHKINPMSSCLPMMFQLPFLLGLYYIIRAGVSPHTTYLLYNFQLHVDLSKINMEFFGLNLALPNALILPIIVGLAQWIAIRITFVKQKKRTQKAGKDAPIVPDQMQQMNAMMQWVMPVMIGFFTAALPAGVGIYWLTSTLFGIGQQEYVNRQVDQHPEVRRKDS